MVKCSKIPIFPIFLLDIILVNLSFLVALLIWFGFALNKHNIDPYLSLFPWISILAGFTFSMFDLYSNWIRKSIQDLISSIILSIVTLLLLTMALIIIDQGYAFPRSVIIIGAILQFISISLSRSVIWLLNKRAFGSQRVLIIIQDFKEFPILAEKIFQHTKGWFTIGGFLTANNLLLSELESSFKDIDVVLISTNIPNKNEIVNLCIKFGKEILIVPQLSDLILLRSEPQQVDDVLVLSIRPYDLNLRQLFFKRLFDIIAALVLLAVFSPIIITLFMAIPLSSKGPALFKQERLGKNMDKYLIYKFRSMNHNAEERCGPILATHRDPRITKIGRFIRATRLDELPQLYNVLNGEMSLVGPRPERLYFVSQFEQTVPHYSYRMSIKPGITGLAQVMGRYSTTVEDKLRLDMMYMYSYSFALDLKILFQTVGVVLKREQAAGVMDCSVMNDLIFRKVGS
ncbi:MAG: sugar transferase [Desulfosporosinus sp.]|nr:sugar transferase [Desulfosporosinus sp.]